MFTNLIESDSHRKEFKRRSSFFLATVAAYALILFATGIASIYAYDAHLEAQNTDITLLSWVPPLKPIAERERPRETQTPRRTAPSTAPVDRTARVQERTEAISTTADPSRTPDHIGTTAPNVPPVTDSHFVISDRNVNPDLATRGSGGCLSCTGTDPVVRVPDTTPPPLPVTKPTIQRQTSKVLTSHAISLPQPAYPPMARQIRIGGPVAIQILVDEQGNVVSAQVVSGHPMLVGAAKEAALRARFTATVLNGQAVKVQGVITYNFVMQ